MNAPAIIQGTAAVRIDPTSVAGWGVDADPQNDPTYPYRERGNDDHSGVWDRPSVQDPGVEVLQSVEHVRRPAVVGTSTPPRGLSGQMRRAAFRWSESNLLHWMILLGADRVNVVEGVLEDFARGKVPNVLAEMGIRAELQHNKAGLLKKVAIGAAVVGAVSLLASMKSRQTEVEPSTPRRK
jgi:hypothetical protein